ncbi:hypothetical protein [Jeotgalibacillus proteolyticus]|uniref:HeH/LEM domain-containing protein n=1 Tax=Jeotgalibacillus proteolyticus TaxID=2082395 RepID=A0A2S5GAT9_9BACL|nr:hypothetical protein [Jeotgalibacillus proteolyticus]PPA70041.1 hypothetical protein C4B60_10625 [Jeotgalibacillus proteolyticus]
MKVTVKDTAVVYNGKRYEPKASLEVDEKHFNENLFSKNEAASSPNDEETDYFGFTAEQLEKVSNDKLKAFLDKEGIEYKSSDKKEDFINLIVGE